MAMWSNVDRDVGNRFDHNTIQTPVLANGIAIYGGEDNTVSDNLVADPVREGSALHAGYRHASTDFQGHLTFARNTTVRAGTRELNWDIGLGAIWFYALEGHMKADFRVVDSDFLDVSYNAIQFVSEWARQGPVRDRARHDRRTSASTAPAPTCSTPARSAAPPWRTSTPATSGSASTTTAARSTSRRPGPEFKIAKVGGNDGGWSDWARGATTARPRWSRRRPRRGRGRRSRRAPARRRRRRAGRRRLAEHRLQRLQPPGGRLAQLRERVLAAAAELGYAGADPAARSLRSGRTGAIGVVLRERLAYSFDDPAAVRFLQGVSDAADPQQLALVIVPAYPEQAGTFSAAIGRAAVDGLLLYSLVADDPLVEASLRRRLPTVVIDSPAPESWRSRIRAASSGSTSARPRSPPSRT